MANSYTQVYLMLVFAVKNRHNLITPLIENRLYPYITQLIKKREHKMLQINGNRNHIHILIRLNPKQALSNFVKEIKSISSKFINDHQLLQAKFKWQRGYGAFSYSHSQLDNVIRYIKNQKEHHKIKSFKTEYLELLKKYNIDYDSKYLFDFFD